MKKRAYFFCLILFFANIIVFGIFPYVKGESVGAPSFNKNFAEVIENKQMKPDEKGRIEWSFDRKIDRTKSIKENVIALFYPKADGTGWQLRDLLRTVMFAVIFGMLIWTGFLFVKDANDGKEKEYWLTVIYIIIWATIVLSSTRVLGNAINFNQGSKVFVSTLEKNVFFQVLSFLKAAAFFAAIVLIIRHWYRIMMAKSKEEKLEKGKTSILNVIVALIFIKGIDFIYYIAQLENFKEKATEAIWEIAKIFWRIVGSAMVLMFLYGWFKMLTDGGKGEWFAAFKKIAVSVFLSALVIFLFLLIMYQVIQEFA